MMMRVEFEAFPRYNASNVPNCHIGGAAFSYPAIRHVFQWGRVLELRGLGDMSLGIVLSEAIKVAIFLAKVTRTPIRPLLCVYPQNLT